VPSDGEDDGQSVDPTPPALDPSFSSEPDAEELSTPSLSTSSTGVTDDASTLLAEATELTEVTETPLEITPTPSAPETIQTDYPDEYPVEYEEPKGTSKLELAEEACEGHVCRNGGRCFNSVTGWPLIMSCWLCTHS